MENRNDKMKRRQSQEWKKRFFHLCANNDVLTFEKKCLEWIEKGMLQCIMDFDVEKELSPLCRAIRYGIVKAVKWMIEYKADMINIPGRELHSPHPAHPILVAIRENQLEIAKLLMDSRADLSVVCPRTKMNILHYIFNSKLSWDLLNWSSSSQNQERIPSSAKNGIHLPTEAQWRTIKMDHLLFEVDRENHLPLFYARHLDPFRDNQIEIMGPMVENEMKNRLYLLRLSIENIMPVKASVAVIMNYTVEQTVIQRIERKKNKRKPKR